MKKRILIFTGFIFSVVLMAGGNIDKALPSVVKVPAVPMESFTYMEKDSHLLWQDQIYTDAEKNAFKNNYSVGKAGTHQHAVQYCQHLHYAGFSDWRLPTSDELIHLHHKQGQVFRFGTDNDFWSSTPASMHKYYVVFPADAYRYERKQRESNFIRCVRKVIQR